MLLVRFDAQTFGTKKENTKKQCIKQRLTDCMFEICHIHVILYQINKVQTKKFLTKTVIITLIHTKSKTRMFGEVYLK